MTDIPILITDNNAPSVDMYAMECTLEVNRREVLNGAEKSTECKWSGFASLEVVDAMLELMRKVVCDD